MRVHPSQLRVGCVVLDDIKGKSGRPIIPKKTILTETHLKVLEKFLVKEVNVSNQLQDKKTFHSTANQK